MTSVERKYRADGCRSSEESLVRCALESLARDGSSKCLERGDYLGSTARKAARTVLSASTHTLRSDAAPAAIQLQVEDAKASAHLSNSAPDVVRSSGVATDVQSFPRSSSMGQQPAGEDARGSAAQVPPSGDVHQDAREVLRQHYAAEGFPGPFSQQRLDNMAAHQTGTLTARPAAGAVGTATSPERPLMLGAAALQTGVAPAQSSELCDTNPSRQTSALADWAPTNGVQMQSSEGEASASDTLGAAVLQNAAVATQSSEGCASPPSSPASVESASRQAL